jgi:hypothetical protein
MEQQRKNDPAVQQIIDRVLAQHFGINKPERKSIGEIQDEMLREIHSKAQVIDFAKGESCEFE